MPETVSIVIPTFNRVDLLGRAIDSALAQTMTCEVIVADHGSTDATPDLAASYGDKITYVRRERDFGPHYVWLDGVMHSTGDLVHLQYDDDWIDPGFIEACVGVMTEKTGFAFSAAKIMEREDADPIAVTFTDWFPQTGTYKVKQVERKLIRSLLSPGCCVFRRQTLIDALYQGQLPLPLHHYHGVGPDNYMTLLSMLRYDEFGYVKEPLAYFLSHEGSITIDAINDETKARALNNAYNDVRRFYRELKFLKRWRALRGIKS